MPMASIGPLTRLGPILCIVCISERPRFKLIIAFLILGGEGGGGGRRSERNVKKTSPTAVGHGVTVGKSICESFLYNNKKNSPSLRLV